MTDGVTELVPFETEQEFLSNVVLESTAFNDRHRNIVRIAVAQQVNFELSYLGKPALEFEKIYK